MEVNTVSSQTKGIVPNGRAIRTKPKHQHKVRVNPANDEIPEGDKTKGVIRNLLDGHYKGVADVRLRIVHFEELSQIENNNLKDAAGDKVSQLLGTVDSSVNDLLGSIPPTQVNTESEDAQDTAAIVSELYQEFTTSVNQLMEDFVSFDNPSADSLIMEIEGFFEAFITSLKDLLIPPTEEPLTETEPTEEEPPAPETETLTVEEPIESQPVSTAPTAEEEPPAPEVVPETLIVENPTEGQPEPSEPTAIEEEPTAPPDPDYTSLIDSISTAFATAITDFAQVLNGLSALPELTAPTGNGTAYDKFLSIYNQMRGIETTQEDPTNSDSIDTIA